MNVVFIALSAVLIAETIALCVLCSKRKSRNGFDSVKWESIRQHVGKLYDLVEGE